MNKEKIKRVFKNILVFSSPLFIAFFTQLQLGVSFRDTLPLVIVAAYGIAADVFRKLGEDGN